MKEFFKDIMGDKIMSTTFFINVAIAILTVVYILFFYGKLPPLIPVFNQLPWGEQRLGSTIAIFIPSLIALSIFVINTFIAKFVYEKIPLISRMIAAVSLLIQILTFILIIRTITLIT